MGPGNLCLSGTIGVRCWLYGYQTLLGSSSFNLLCWSPNSRFYKTCKDDSLGKMTVPKKRHFSSLQRPFMFSPRFTCHSPIL